MNETDKLKVSYETSLTTAEHKTNLEIPITPINELVNATTRCIDTIRKCPERICKMLSNSTTTLGKPIGAWLEGKAYEIAANKQLIVANIMQKKEVNAIKHLKYVAEEFNYKIENNEEIPERIEESDSLLLIQDNASTTSNEEFLKLWAKLYVQEACKPGTVSRKTIKLFESMDSNIVKIMENEIFPFCDNKGFYWGKSDEITSITLAQDYGFIDDKPIAKYTQNYKEAYCTILNPSNIMYIHPGFGYANRSHYVLTKSGLEVKNLLKIYPNRTQLKTIFKEITDASKYWDIVDCLNIKLKTNTQIQKFVICNRNQKVKYPQNSEYKTLKDFKIKSLEHIEAIN